MRRERIGFRKEIPFNRNRLGVEPADQTYGICRRLFEVFPGAVTLLLPSLSSGFNRQPFCNCKMMEIDQPAGKFIDHFRDRLRVSEKILTRPKLMARAGI